MLRISFSMSLTEELTAFTYCQVNLLDRSLANRPTVIEHKNQIGLC